MVCFCKSLIKYTENFSNKLIFSDNFQLNPRVIEPHNRLLLFL